MLPPSPADSAISTSGIMGGSRSITAHSLEGLRTGDTPLLSCTLRLVPRPKGAGSATGDVPPDLTLCRRYLLLSVYLNFRPKTNNLLLQSLSLSLSVRQGPGSRLISAEPRSELAQGQTRLRRDSGADPEIMYHQALQVSTSFPGLPPYQWPQCPWPRSAWSIQSPARPWPASTTSRIEDPTYSPMLSRRRQCPCSPPGPRVAPASGLRWDEVCETKGGYLPLHRHLNYFVNRRGGSAERARPIFTRATPRPLQRFGGSSPPPRPLLPRRVAKLIDIYIAVNMWVALGGVTRKCLYINLPGTLLLCSSFEAPNFDPCRAGKHLVSDNSGPSRVLITVVSPATTLRIEGGGVSGTGSSPKEGQSPPTPILAKERTTLASAIRKNSSS